MVEPPIWKICNRQIGSIFPNFRGENSKNIWVATTQKPISRFSSNLKLHHYQPQTSPSNRPVWWCSGRPWADPLVSKDKEGQGNNGAPCSWILILWVNDMWRAILNTTKHLKIIFCRAIACEHAFAKGKKTSYLEIHKQLRISNIRVYIYTVIIMYMYYTVHGCTPTPRTATTLVWHISPCPRPKTLDVATPDRGIVGSTRKQRPFGMQTVIGKNRNL